MKKDLKRKLPLKVENIRVMTDLQAAAVAGGSIAAGCGTVIVSCRTHVCDSGGALC